MDLCGCGAATVPDKPTTVEKTPGWQQKPSKYDLSVVAGDSLSMTVTLDWEAFLPEYPSLYLTSQIRGSVSGLTDGFFCDANSKPLTRAEILDLDPPEDSWILRETESPVLDIPELYTRVDTRLAGEFSGADFSADFGVNGLIVKSQYVPLEGELGRSRISLALFPLMTRHLYELALKPDYEYIPCSHLPPSANVPATATGYPPPYAYRAGTGWKSAISLPSYGGEYDSRTDSSIPDPLPQDPFYQGVWDLQIASVDGRYARTVVSGSITVVGDVSRKAGTDE